MSIALFDKLNPAKVDRGLYFFHIKKKMNSIASQDCTKKESVKFQNYI